MHSIPPEKVKLKTMPPELTAPVATYLSHESCTLNGEVLVTGGGKVMRLVVMETKGIQRDDLTPEQIAESLDAVLDMTDAQHIPIILGAH